MIGAKVRADVVLSILRGGGRKGPRTYLHPEPHTLEQTHLQDKQTYK